MSITNDIKRAAKPRDNDDVLRAYRTAYGAKATRHFAEHRGIGIRQAQRHFAGQVNDPGDYEDQVPDDTMFLADALSTAHMLNCGEVKVTYNGKSQGTRTVGALMIDDDMRNEINNAINAYWQGDTGKAEQHMANAILGGYGRDRAGETGRHIAKDTLQIGSFTTGFSIT